MITVLLQQILDLLSDHFPGVISLLEKLNLIEPDVEEIRQDVDAINTNVSSILATANGIRMFTENIAQTVSNEIKNDVNSIKLDTANIKNNISTISTNTGRAASFAEDCANNTLDIDQKITSIASDTTQMRADNQTLIANTNDVETILALGLTKDINQAAGSFETDLNNNLKSLIVQIPADSNGISGLNIIKTKKNILGGARLLNNLQNTLTNGTTDLVNKTFTYSSGYTINPGWSFSKGITFKANTQYTFIYTCSGSQGRTNARIYYTDGTYSAFPNLSDVNVKETVVFVSTEGKTVDRFTKSANAGNTVVYYDESGVFEGVLTAADFVPYEEETTPISFTSITDGGKLDITNGYLYKPDLTVESITPVNVRADIGYNFIYSDIGLLDFTYEESMSRYLTEINNV